METANTPLYILPIVLWDVLGLTGTGYIREMIDVCLVWDAVLALKKSLYVSRYQ